MKHLGETLHIIEAMKATGNQPGVIAQWKDKVAAWARLNQANVDGAAVNAWLPLWQLRPFYTADELAPLWPALAIATGYTDRWPAVLKSPRRLEHEFEFFNMPSRLLDDKKYFAVERLHYWRIATNYAWRQELRNVFG